MEVTGYDFVITPEQTGICQNGETTTGCTVTSWSFTLQLSGTIRGMVPSGSATSVRFGDTPANSYLVFMNDDHSNSDRTGKIGQIVFENEILGVWTHPYVHLEMRQPVQVFLISQSLVRLIQPVVILGLTQEARKDVVYYTSSTTSSTTSGDWVSIGSDKKTLRVGVANGQKGDYFRVITKASTPPTINAIADVTVNENAAYTSVTPSITGSCVGSCTYTISGTDAGDFSINSSTGVVTMVARNYESPADSDTNNTYALTITVTDADNNTDSEAWVVTVADVTETVSFTINAIADVTINENAAYTSVTPALSGTPIGSVTYTISGTDAGDFSINSSTGVVTMVARNYESPADSDTDNTYALTITVTDADNNSDSEAWVVTVADVTETVSFTINAIADVTVNENAAYTSVTPALSGTPIGSVTYTISGGTDAG